MNIVATSGGGGLGELSPPKYVHSPSDKKYWISGFCDKISSSITIISMSKRKNYHVWKLFVI